MMNNTQIGFKFYVFIDENQRVSENFANMFLKKYANLLLSEQREKIKYQLHKNKTFLSVDKTMVVFGEPLKLTLVIEWKKIRHFPFDVEDFKYVRHLNNFVL